MVFWVLVRMTKINVYCKREIEKIAEAIINKKLNPLIKQVENMRAEMLKLGEEVKLRKRVFPNDFKLNSGKNQR